MIAKGIGWFFEIPKMQHHIKMYKDENGKQALEVIPITDWEGNELEYAKNLNKQKQLRREEYAMVQR